MDEKYRWALVLGLHRVQVGDLITEQMGQDLFFSSTSTLSAILQNNCLRQYIFDKHYNCSFNLYGYIPIFTSFIFIDITDTS